MRILPRMTLLLISKIFRTIGRDRDYYDSENEDNVWFIEDENEGVAIIGTIKDILMEYNIEWQFTRPSLWLGIATFEDGDLGISLSTQYRRDRLTLAVAVG